MKRSARSAFAARKQTTQVVAPKARVENESEEVGGEENDTLDELSDQEIQFSNAFDVLKDSVVSAPPPAKKLKQTSLPRLNGKLSTCYQERVEIIDNETLKVTLLPDEIITICGTCLLSVARGAVSILGAKLDASTPPAFHPIYAPQSHSLPVITGLKSRKGKTGKAADVKSIGSILYLKNCKSGIELLSEVCPFAENLFRPPLNSIAVSLKNPSFHIMFDCPTPTAQTIYPLSWVEACESMTASPAPKILVCGPKGVGKSTFCQFLVNSLVPMSTVTYLETDPGQPSFSPPGLVSLHQLTDPIFSPPFIRSGMNDLIRSHHIGNISPRDNPRHYIDCISNLLSHDSGNAPTVINTPGWTKGTGFELLTSLIEIASPDFILVLSNAGNETLARNLHPLASKLEIDLLLVEAGNTIPPVIPLTAADLRTLGIMSYFHRIGFDTWDFTTHLMAWKPWIVKFNASSEERGICGIAIQGEELLPEDIVLAINGTMVAIILISSTSNEKISLTPEGIPMLSDREVKFMDPGVSRCVGYGVIRGIDVRNGWLMLLSPWEPSALEEGEKVVLERGRVSLPVWGMWDHKNPQVLGPWLQRQ